AAKERLVKEIQLAVEDGDRIAAGVAKLGKNYEDSVNRLETQKMLMKKQYTDLTAALDSKQEELDTMTALYKEAKQELSRPNGHAVELQNQLDLMTSEREKLEQKIRLVEEELDLQLRQKEGLQLEAQKDREEKEALVNFLQAIAEQFNTSNGFEERPNASVAEHVDAGIRELYEKCMAAKARADKAEDEVRTSEAEKEALSADNQALMEKLQNLQDVLRESEELRLKLRDVEDTLLQIKSQMETEKQRAGDSLLQLQDMFQDLQGDADLFSADFNGAVLRQVTFLIEADILRRREQSMHQLETARAINDAFKTLQDERDQLAGQVHQMACDSEKKDRALADLKADISGLYSAISNYEEQLAESHAELTAMREEAESQEISVEEKEKTVLLLLEREQELKQLQHKLQESESSLAEMQGNTTAMLEELESLRAKEQLESNEREKMATSLVEKSDTISHLEEKIKEMEAELARLQLENVEMSELTSTLRAKNEDLSNVAAEVSEKLKLEMEHSAEQRNKIQATCVVYSSQVEHETQTTDELGDTDIKSQLEEALKQLDQVKDDHKKCKSEYEILTRECTEQLDKLE
ncbi:unnamed protein product, partial [Ixodes hexagonus]